jgi:pimeloyl-ACP methyl ester carboxylesterase
VSPDAPYDFLDVGDASVAYTVAGSGPALLVPWCNFPWPGTTSVETLARQFTVVVAAPRGYAASTWVDDGRYGTRQVCDDLLAVCDALGLGHVAVLGYSLTAAVALRLAASSDRVDAVVAGGFPLFADYHLLRDDARRQTDTGDDERARAELSRRLGFDTRAARAFYDELATLEPGGLLDDVRCPVYTFWGTADEVIDGFEGLAHLESEVRRRGIEHRVLEGTDHATTLFGLDRVLPEVSQWLLGIVGST